jgi:hypothetical protein
MSVTPVGSEQLLWHFDGNFDIATRNVAIKLIDADVRLSADAQVSGGTSQTDEPCISHQMTCLTKHVIVDTVLCIQSKTLGLRQR